MCGIFFSIHADNNSCSDSRFLSICHALKRNNADRGPDAQGNHRIHITTSTPISQGISHQIDHNYGRVRFEVDFYASELRLRGESPIFQPHVQRGNILCWNGEIFDGLEVPLHENDGVKMLDSLHNLKTGSQIRDFFGTVEGPYAFVFYQKESECLFFARDPLGRRSLLIHRPTPDQPYLLLSSVSAGLNAGYNFDDVSTDFIYCLSLRSLASIQDYNRHLQCLPRSTPDRSLPYARPSKINESLPPDELAVIESASIPSYLSQVVDDLIDQLNRSVLLRIRNIPRISGPSRSASVAILFSGGIDSTVLAFFAHKHIPLDEPIDLLNVAFENPRKLGITTQESLSNSPRRAKKEKISQLNGSNEPTGTYLVPDRVTGLLEVEELRRIYPGRVWNFVEINVPYQESQSARETIESLMIPGRTVMDLSLALALYFASRGQGQIRTSLGSEPEMYTSVARVVISGLGSDELMGGYGRHRSAFYTGGWEAVIKELQLEIDRIPTRNLGRDDRIVSSHGKETRHPFLSLDVVRFLASLPIHLKMDPRADLGVGDKMILRLLAQRVGLVEASSRKKRAMQFGSHSARMGGEKRGDVDLV
ncbi:hypothetical protein K443DRAFT_93427 [Laccaria amethystina LaAM-08-1]|uniref:Unplaced genomic scaffold K443scaffold_36, whole genome shotgun sequence n=1 Tax=Laccaria amethystina LaAM-08-1 TaxID=1095629 RepID=A0A0C9Y8B1_9AGAR|nr:hypothetical protein K443DRAFT_93427 [Laccaria amethystina LaAM-08-1]